MSLGSWIWDEANDVISRFLSFFGAIGKIAGMLLAQNFKDLANQLIPFAAQFILAAAKDPSMIGDSDKRGAVLKQLGDQAISMGISMGLNDLSILLENTLKLLKSDPAQPLTTDAPPTLVDLPPAEPIPSV